MEPMQMQQPFPEAKIVGRPKQKEYKSCLTLLKLFLLIFTIIFVCAGLCLIGIGIWMKADPYIAHFFTIAAYNYHHSLLHAGSTMFICAGVIIIIIGVIGFVGTIMENRLFLFIFICAMALIFCLQLSAGILAAIFRHNIYNWMRNSMTNNLQEHYRNGSSFAYSWDFVQVRMKCCGSQGPEDYRNSVWYINNKRKNLEDMYVPWSCCVLIYDQARDVSRIDPKDIKPQSRLRCQRDAHGNIPTEFLHGYGCFVKIHHWVFERSSIIIGLGFGAAIVQVFGLITAIGYLTSVQRKNLRS